MTDQTRYEFSSFLRLLTGENKCRYIDDARSLRSKVKEASASEIGQPERRRRIDVLSDFCRELVHRLDTDRTFEYRYRIPCAVREMGLPTFDHTTKMLYLGSFELAVRYFENPNSERGRWPSSPPQPT